MEKAHQRFFELVWFDTSYKEGITLLQGGHQQVQRLLKLRRQSYHLPLVALLSKTLDVLSKQGLDELVLRCG